MYLGVMEHSSLKRDNGEAPKKPAWFTFKINLTVRYFYWLNTQYEVRITTILWQLLGMDPKYCSVVSIMAGDFTEGGEGHAPALNELTV